MKHLLTCTAVLGLMGCGGPADEPPPQATTPSSSPASEPQAEPLHPLPVPPGEVRPPRPISESPPYTGERPGD